MGERTGSETKYSANGNGNGNGLNREPDKEPDNFNVEKVMKELNRVCFRHDVAVLEHVEPLAHILLDNPSKGIQLIRGTYEKGLDDAYGKDRAFIESIAGGPAEAVPWSVYNAVGAVYPYLNREKKDKALAQLFSIMDQLNYAIVNGERGVGHTTGIREPLLLADIQVARWLYWPGLDEGKYIIKQFDNFSDLQHALIDENGMFRPKSSAHSANGPPSGVNSDFIVAYSLLRKKYSDFGEYYMDVANPSFLERVVKGIVALRFGFVQSEQYIEQHGKEKSEKHIVKGMARLKELLPESLHDRLEPLKQEADWVNPDKFP